MPITVPTVEELRAKHPYCDDDCLLRNQEWWRRHAEQVAKAEAYEEKYPDFCDECNGSGIGGSWYEYGSYNVDPCEAERCYGEGYCPQCRKPGASKGLGGVPWEDPDQWLESGAEECAWCGWNWKRGDAHPLAYEEGYYCDCEDRHWEEEHYRQGRY